MIVAWEYTITRGMAEAEPEQTANSSESADGETEDAAEVADPFVVPDGAADRLLKYISDLQKLPMPQGDREESIRIVAKIVLSR